LEFNPQSTIGPFAKVIEVSTDYVTMYGLHVVWKIASSLGAMFRRYFTSILNCNTNFCIQWIVCTFTVLCFDFVGMIKKKIGLLACMEIASSPGAMSRRYFTFILHCNTNFCIRWIVCAFTVLSFDFLGMISLVVMMRRCND
jgi:hypothetical protein